MIENGKTIDLSIMINTYNAEKYVSQALESIIHQETKYSFEVVISDDCSTDKTAQIIRDYSHKYPDIIKPILREKNIGAIQNCIQTMQELSGKYFMFIDGDDYWLPGKIEKQLDFMENHPEIGLCYGQVYVLNDKTGVISKNPTRYDYTQFKEFLFHNGANTCTQCGRLDLYKKYYSEVLPDCHGWLMLDYPLVLWYSKNSKVHSFSEVFAVYRVRVGSLSHPKDVEKNLAFTKSTMEIQKFFSDSEEDIRKIEIIYQSSVAENYWIFGDMKQFRKCYRMFLSGYGRKVDKIKFWISYLPFFGYFYKSFIRIKNYKA